MNTRSGAENRGLLTRLPVGRSPAVRALLIAGGLLTALCMLWLRDLRANGTTLDISLIFMVLFRYFDYDAAILALGILVLAVFVPRWNGFDRLLRWLGEYPLSIAVSVSLLCSLGARFFYREHPLSMDEYASLFQSQVFAAGKISGQFPVDLLDFLIPKDFQNHFLNVSRATGATSANYWPSFALLLTPFSLLGIPWACNAVLSGATLLVMNRLALRLFASTEAAGMVTLLTLASPVFFADGISYYSMTAHLLANALFALLLLDPTPRRLFGAGVVGSIALTLHNPVPHILFALPWFVWLAQQGRPVARLGVLWAGYLPLSILLGIGWFLHTGQLVQGGGSVNDAAGNFGSIASAFAWPSAKLWFARLIGLAKLMLWAAPCVLLLACAGAWRARSDARFATLVASALLTFVGYLFVWVDQGHGWGFRYFHSAWLVLPLCATAFLYAPSKPQVPASAPFAATAPEASDVRTYVVACALLSLLAGVGQRSMQIREFIDDHLSQVPHYRGSESRVVVIANVGLYTLDLVQNDPFLRSPEVRMVGSGTKDETAAAIRRHFPGYHRVYTDDNGEVWSMATPTPSAVPR